MQEFIDNIVWEFTRTFITDNRWKLFLEGFKNTLTITVLAVLVGVALGTVISVVHYVAAQAKSKIKRKSDPFLKKLGRGVLLFADRILAAYVAVMRGSPLAIQIMIMSFVVMRGFSDKVIVASVAFGLNSAAYVSEVIRGGINSVDSGQMEAGRSVGLSQIAALRLIVLPQAIKNILPALCNEFIAVLKETSIVGLIAVTDLTRASDLVRSRTLSAFFPLISAGIVYFVLVALLSTGVSKLEARLAQSDRS
ncbi:MAG: amino acid ABC transporter permease [Oscillospiraceae bacterium]|nr:amino acid ABC transporter permease [Oscillospiraceae bacterium]